MLPDNEWLASFVAFCDGMSFTRAARARHLSQPALYAQVAKLAEALGVTLYRRDGRRLLLTREGERVAAFARDLDDRGRRFLDELRTGDTRQPVVLAAGEGAFLYLLGPAIRRCAPHLPLRLLTRDADATVAALRHGEAHLGVAQLEGAPAGLIAEELTRVPQVLALPATHGLARRRRLALRDLDGQRLVVPPEGRPLRSALAGALLSANVDWELAMEAGGWPLMLEAVARGVGLAVVNGCCRVPTGVVMRPLPELPLRVYWLLARPRALDDARLSRVAAHIRATRRSWRRASRD